MDLEYMVTWCLDRLDVPLKIDEMNETSIAILTMKFLPLIDTHVLVNIGRMGSQRILLDKRKLDCGHDINKRLRDHKHCSHCKDPCTDIWCKPC